MFGWEKTKIIKSDSAVLKRYSLMGKTILEKEKGENISWHLLGMSICSYRNKKHKDYHRQQKITFFQNCIRNHQTVILWIDHALGGGTETYSIRQFSQATKKTLFVRLQPFELCHELVLSLPNHPSKETLAFDTLEHVFDFLKTEKLDEIVINNLVGYKSSLSVLEYVSLYKKNRKEVKISFRGHDYHSICPCFDLMDFKEEFCFPVRKDMSQCERCLREKKFHTNPSFDQLLRSGSGSRQEWRAAWKKFFTEDADEIIVFSTASAKLFVDVYPIIEQKITVRPHTVPSLRKVHISPHKELNIGILGTITSAAKGMHIVEELALASLNTPFNVKIIGDFSGDCSHIHTITGKYTLSQLPRIVEKEKIDIFFIPSIWMETFSYTTSEAISMGLPVACFNIGAQAEKCLSYSKGLVIEHMDANHALQQIRKYLNSYSHLA